MANIDCVLLVDDSPSTNFYNRKLIEIVDVATNIFDVENGIEALEYITHKGKFKDKTAFPRPNIIFLDINMPKMDGFEFMEQYQKLPKKQRADMLIVFLTTSNWAKEKLKALDNTLVYDFVEKPLEISVLKKIKKHYNMSSFSKVIEKAS